MRPVGTWLERFRRPAAVPAAAGEEIEAELMPVFDLLDEVEGEARALVAEAEAEAARRVEAGAVEAERLRALWRRRADVERARAEHEHGAATKSKALELAAEAQTAADEARARGLEQLPGLVNSVLACLTGEQR